jgi:uncharacterized protein (TIGR03435 family)
MKLLIPALQRVLRLPDNHDLNRGELKCVSLQMMTRGALRNQNLGKRSLLLAVGSLIVAAPPMQGQAASADRQTAPPEIRYEVATVKPNNTGCCTSSRATADQMMLTNETLKNLVVLAYTVQPDQVTGPDWITKVRFDITGKFPPGTKYADRWRMLQTLLKDRFNLITHTDTKEMPGYSLQVAKTGFRLKPSEPGEASTSGGPQGTVYTFDAQKIPISTLTWELSDFLGQVVVDQTGLQGTYSFQLRWATNALPTEGTASASEPAPSVFTALQETLGLRLQHGKVNAPVIVIDHAEMPAEN